MPHNDLAYLQHILDAISWIEHYLQGIDETLFYESHLIQDGVIRQIEIIGEATKHLSKALRDNYPQIPWQDMAGMRDKLIHHYFGVDIGAIWLTAKEDIPLLKMEVETVVDELGRPTV